MEHPTLGTLTKKENNEGSLYGNFSYINKTIPFEIDQDTDSMEDAINLASEIIGFISKYDARAKEIISKELLEKYNSGWNEYDEAQEDGSFKTIIKPKLSVDEFEDQFILKSINICGNSCVELWYEENDLFWGHSVFVTTFEGVCFKNAKAQMFG